MSGTERAAKPAKKKRRRTIENRPEDRAGMWMQVTGVLDNPTYWEFCASIPTQSIEGQRRKLPTIFYVAMPAFAAIWRSYSATETALREDPTWKHLCWLVCKYQRKYRPHDEPFDVRALRCGPKLTAQNFRDARKSWLAPHWDRLRDTYRPHAAAAARELGYCDPSGPGGINELRRERMLVGDGKVTSEPGSIYRPLTAAEIASDQKYGEMSHVRDKRTGKIIPVAQMTGSAWIYKDGAGRVTIGYKTARVSVRDNVHSNSTIILDVAADDDRDEAKLALKMLIDAKAALPGTLGVVYDAALRGTHLATLARHGLVTVAPIAAKENPGRGRNSSKRVEKQGNAGAYSHDLDNGTQCVHELAYRGGQVCEVTVDAAGRKLLHPLGDPHLELRSGKQIQRLYVRYDLTCHRHEATENKLYAFSIRWNLSGTTTEHGTKDKFNVAENIRALPPAGPKYTAAFGWRQTIENDNNQSDRRKVLGRGRSHGARHNLINEIGFAMVITGIAVQQARARRATADVGAPPISLATAA